jgi:hypothetical protein
MGFFSWKTQDTDKSIANRHSIMPVFTVHMIDDKGNVWTEYNYNGYGMFDGKDFYELVAEMNGYQVNEDADPDQEYEKLRSKGIEIAFGDEPYKSPNLVEQLDGWEYVEESPVLCEYQGFFY